ncbi:G-protein coupled receptor 20-like [Symphalangus syndactylus]|uniref:G-protein coupled receptor 20-like n=1 Tax=Symphalangus syndactylus TaxID=9590 RepID=UPI0024425C5B|nr:G-protein coupled receptor 20-like [Symphalangus syndactylus]
MTLLASSWCPRPMPWRWAWGCQPTGRPWQCSSAAAGAWARPCFSTCSAWPWSMSSSRSRCSCGSPTTWAWPGGRLPRGRGHLLPVHLCGGGLRRAHQRVPLGLRTRPRPRAAARLALCHRRPARAACAFAWLAGLAPPCLEHRWASSGLASATVAFFAAAFLLVLAAYVSLVRALKAPSGPGPATAGAHRRAAKTMVLGFLLVFALSLAPYHLLLAPWVARRDDDGDRCRAASTLDILHTLSLALLSLNSCLDPLICCCFVRRFHQDCCWALGCPR